MRKFGVNYEKGPTLCLFMRFFAVSDQIWIICLFILSQYLKVFQTEFKLDFSSSETWPEVVSPDTYAFEYILEIWSKHARERGESKREREKEREGGVKLSLI